MPVIVRQPNWSRIEGKLMSLAFHHADPKNVGYNLSFFISDSNIEITLNQDGATHYIPEKYWDELVEVIKLADKETQDFYAAVNIAIDEDKMKEPQGDEDYIPAPDIDALF